MILVRDEQAATTSGDGYQADPRAYSASPHCWPGASPRENWHPVPPEYSIR
jgi:hypothetical protein